MNIAELFVNLGIKGDKKTLDGVMGVDKGLKDTASSAFAAKAAIVGAMYALERLFATSGKAGTDLTNFNATVGTSAQILQQYQYAARQVGVSNEEVAGSFRTLQNEMTKTLLNGDAPKGLARVAQLLGNFSPKDIEAFAKKPELLFQKLQEYANKERSLPLRNEVLRTFGLSDNVIASMARNAYRSDVLSKAPTYSDSEIKRLDKANIAWSNLGTTVEMAIGHLNAAHGGQLVGDISKLVGEVVKLSEAFLHLSEKLKLFKGIDLIFKGWENIFNGISDSIDKITEFADHQNNPDAVDKNGKPVKYDNDPQGMVSEEDRKLSILLGSVIGAAFKNLKSDSSLYSGLTESGAKNAASDATLFSSFVETLTGKAVPVKTAKGAKITPPQLKLVVPPLPAVIGAKAVATPPISAAAKGAAGAAGTPGAPGKIQDIKVNQTLNFDHSGVDPSKTAKSTKSAVREAFRELSAQGEGG